MSNAVANTTIVANLEALKAAVKAQPQELFDLAKYRRESSCGTLYCTAGLAATMPMFQAQGMGFEQYSPTVYHVTIDGEHIHDTDEKTDGMFGPDAWSRLFSSYGTAEADAEGCDAAYARLYGKTEDGDIDWDKELVGHKELAIERLERQIAALKGEVA